MGNAIYFRLLVAILDFRFISCVRVSKNMQIYYGYISLNIITKEY